MSNSIIPLPYIYLIMSIIYMLSIVYLCPLIYLTFCASPFPFDGFIPSVQLRFNTVWPMSSFNLKVFQEVF